MNDSLVSDSEAKAQQYREGLAQERETNSNLQHEIDVRDNCFKSLAKMAGVEETQFAAWVCRKAVPFTTDTQ